MTTAVYTFDPYMLQLLNDASTVGSVNGAGTAITFSSMAANTILLRLPIKETVSTATVYRDLTVRYDGKPA